MKKQFIVDIYFEEDNDFEQVDLEEAIKDGIENVGNYEIKDLTVIRNK